MIEDELRNMEKRSRRRNLLAAKSEDRRSDWIDHTLGGIENGVQKGGRKEISQAQAIAKGK